MQKEEFNAFATLVGTVVGAGILGAPYIIAKAGFLTGLLAIILTGFAAMLMHLYLGEIVLRTKGKHQLTGYAQKYLGQKGKYFMTLSMAIGIYGALIIYMIGVSNIASVMIGMNKLAAMALFFIVVSIPIYKGIKAVEKSEAYFAFIPIIIILIIFAVLSPKISAINYMNFNGSSIFLPFGVLLFAFLGTAAIPEMNEELKNKKKIKEVILAGFIFIAIIYALFAFSIVGAVPLSEFEKFPPNERIATIVLGSVVGKSLFILANLFAISAMTTSFLALGLALKEMYQYDYRLKNWISWALTCIIPFIIALGNFADFMTYMGVAGTLSGGIEAVLIVFMLKNAKAQGNRRPEYSSKHVKFGITAVLLAFGIGLVMQFI